MIYSQYSGRFYNDHGLYIGIGYSGNGKWKNDPLSQNVKDHGPIPQGIYTISNPHDSEETGPFTLDLIPNPENNMFGRDSFKIHGDNLSNPGNGSDGCICTSRATRDFIWKNKDHTLKVVV